MSNSLHDTLTHLRERAHTRRTAPAEPYKAETLGEHMADVVAALVGSWRFVLIQSALGLPELDLKHALEVVIYHQQRNFAAYCSHRKRTLKALMRRGKRPK